MSEGSSSPIHSEPPMAIDPPRPADEPLNPYAAPEALGKAEIEPEIIGGDAEVIRRKHIQHEVLIRSIGWFYYIIAFFGMIITAIAVLDSTSRGIAGEPIDRMERVVRLLNALPFAGLTVFLVLIGHGLRTFKNWAHWVNVALTGIGLVAVAIIGVLNVHAIPTIGVMILGLGGLILGSVMALHASSRAELIFSKDYRRIIEATPRVKPKFSPIAWIALGVVVLIGFAIVEALNHQGN